MRTARHVAAATILLALILACGSNGAPGSAPPIAPVPVAPQPFAPQLAPPPPGTLGAGGPGVPRAQFLASWTTIVVNQLCLPTQYFRQCFTNVDEAQCTSLMNTAANNCISQNMSIIPDPIPTGSGESIGRTLGECTGTAYEQAMVMQHRRIDSALCNDATHWM